MGRKKYARKKWKRDKSITVTDRPTDRRTDEAGYRIACTWRKTRQWQHTETSFSNDKEEHKKPIENSKTSHVLLGRSSNATNFDKTDIVTYRVDCTRLKAKKMATRGWICADSFDIQSQILPVSFFVLSEMPVPTSSHCHSSFKAPCRSSGSKFTMNLGDYHLETTTFMTQTKKTSLFAPHLLAKVRRFWQ